VSIYGKQIYSHVNDFKHNICALMLPIRSILTLWVIWRYCSPNFQRLKLRRGVFNLIGIDVCELALTRLILLGFYRMDYTGLVANVGIHSWGRMHDAVVL